MKKLLILTTLIFVLASTVAFADLGISITIDGNKINLQGAEPYLVSGRTLVPIRFISENLGAEVEWDGIKQAAIVKSESKSIIIRVNSKDAVVNETTLTLEIEPRLTNGRVYVPLRAIAELLDVSVDWDNASKTVVIKIKAKDTEVEKEKEPEPVKEQLKQEDIKNETKPEQIDITDIYGEDGYIKQEIARKFERQLLNSLKFEKGKLTGFLPVPPKGFEWEMGFTVEYDPKFKVNNMNMGFLLYGKTLTPGENFEIAVDWTKVTNGYFNVGLCEIKSNSNADWSVMIYPSMKITEYTKRWE